MSADFTHAKAIRENIPMLVGVVGPTGSGKTKSMLRLLTGMVRKTGGKIFVIDTEHRRSAQYADEFDFEIVEFNPPYSPARYQAALEYCKAQGAGAIGVDSMSHEHEGPGGVLDMHDAYVDDKAGDDWKKRERVNASGWILPKRQRAQLCLAMIELGINGVFCFRAKEKIAMKKGKEFTHLGWQPIGGTELFYEMLVSCLLYPGAGGVPNWAPDEKGERVICKLPSNLEGVFTKDQPISEGTGVRLAAWAAGEDLLVDIAVVLTEMEQAQTAGELDAIRNLRGRCVWSKAEVKKIQAAVAVAHKRIISNTSDPAEREEEPDVCGQVPPVSECMQSPGHDGDCDDDEPDDPPPV